MILFYLKNFQDWAEVEIYSVKKISFRSRWKRKQIKIVKERCCLRVSKLSSTDSSCNRPFARSSHTVANHASSNVSNLYNHQNIKSGLLNSLTGFCRRPEIPCRRRRSTRSPSNGSSDVTSNAKTRGRNVRSDQKSKPQYEKPVFAETPAHVQIIQKKLVQLMSHFTKLFQLLQERDLLSNEYLDSTDEMIYL